MDRDTWCSPRAIADPLADFFGGPVDCDPCSNANSVIRARVAYTWAGLHRPWGGRGIGSGKGTAYQNEPYSRPHLWTDKMIHEMRMGRVTELVRLTMVATSTKWWSSSMHDSPRNPRLVFTERLKFIGGENRDGSPCNTGAMFDTVLMYYGRRWRQFERHFKHVARWTRWGR